MADTIIVHCPACRQSYSIDPVTIGREFECSNCGKTFVAAREPVPVPVMPVTSPEVHKQMYRTQPLSRAALASLICGICCWFWPASIAGLVTGIIGVNRTKTGQVRGGGMAITGIVLCSIGLVADPFLYMCGSIMLTASKQGHVDANVVRSQENLQKIGVAFDHYRAASHGENPPNLETLITAENLSTDLFVFPGGTETPANGAADLETGGHLSYTYIPGKQPANGSPRVLMYESGAGHMYQFARGPNLLFSDGEARFEPKAQADASIRQSRAIVK